MSDMTETETENEVEEEVEPVTEYPGKRLRETREQKQLSLEEVASHLHLDAQLIVALEEDDYGKLPSAAYICGYLRAYARILKLPEDEVVNAYSKGKEINASLIPENVKIAPERDGNNAAVVKIIGIALLLFLLSAGLFWVADKFNLFDFGDTKQAQVDNVEFNLANDVNSDAAAETSQVNESIASIEAAPETVNETEAQPLENTDSVTILSGTDTAEENKDIVILFNGDCWTEVTDSTGERLVWSRVSKGTTLAVGGQPPYKILLGKADAVEITYKGNVIEHMQYARGDIASFRLGK